MLSDGLFAYLVARWSVLNTFEAAILRDFGEREDFERVLTHALRRGCGGRVLLSLMADGSLRLTGTKDPDIAFGAVLLDLTAPNAMEASFVSALSERETSTMGTLAPTMMPAFFAPPKMLMALPMALPTS